MQTAVHVGVVVLVVTAKCIEHAFRFLRGRSIVEVDQRLAVRLLKEDRKILADSLPIDGSGNLMHTVICFAHRCLPVYSDAADALRQSSSSPYPWGRNSNRLPLYYGIGCLRS